MTDNLEAISNSELGELVRRAMKELTSPLTELSGLEKTTLNQARIAAISELARREGLAQSEAKTHANATRLSEVERELSLHEASIQYAETPEAQEQERFIRSARIRDLRNEQSRLTPDPAA